MEDSLANPPLLIEEKIIFINGNAKQVFDVSLLLASQKLPHWIEAVDKNFLLLIYSKDIGKIQDLYDTWIKENDIKTFVAPELPALTLKPFLALAFLIPIFIFIRWGDQNWAWHHWGRADSHKILNGEIWRCFTALTLHGDAKHILSNLLSGYFVFNLLQRHLDMGKAFLTLVLTAGIANFLVAWNAGPNHLSVGFSTVVFAALGMLAVLETRFLLVSKKWDLRQYSPILGAICMVVMMGLGEKTDIRAHVFGFVMGCLGGIPFWKKKLNPTSKTALMVAYAVLIFSWFLAKP